MFSTHPPDHGGPRVSYADVRDLGRLRRSRTDRVVAGVAGGVGRHLDIDPLLVRIVLGVATLFGGAGLLGYLILWLTVPEDDKADSVWSGWRRVDARRVTTVGVILAVIGGASLFIGSVGYFTPGMHGFFVVMVLSLVALAVLVRSRRSHDGAQTAPSTAPPGTPPAEPPPSPTGSAAVAAIDQSDHVGATDAGHTDPGTADAGLTDPAPTTELPEAGSGPPGSETTAPSATGTDPAAGTGDPTSTTPATTWPPRPRRPRSHLFAMTMAAALVACGVVAAYDVDHHVAPSIYPGIVLVAAGTGLVISAWIGRARLLIPVGVVAAVATALLSVVDHGPFGDIEHRPVAARDVHDTYRLGAGRLDLDLRSLPPSQLAALDGRTIHLDAEVGRVEVYTPAGLDTTVSATVDGGDLRGFTAGDESGNDLRETFRPVDTTAPNLTIDVALRFGQVVAYTDCSPTNGGSTDVQACR
jgi:phage shock protein PspC (stress-responsive transcriptional regulator)